MPKSEEEKEQWEEAKRRVRAENRKKVERQRDIELFGENYDTVLNKEYNEIIKSPLSLTIDEIHAKLRFMGRLIPDMGFCFIPTTKHTFAEWSKSCVEAFYEDSKLTIKITIPCVEQAYIDNIMYALKEEKVELQQ